MIRASFAWSVLFVVLNCAVRAESGQSAIPIPCAEFAPTALNVTTKEVPYTGVANVLGMSKHLDFARFNNRWYKMCGDHRAIDYSAGEAQDGRQEIFSFNALANDWPADLAHCEQPYYIKDTKQVQFAFPDDTFAVSVENEIWVFPGPTANPIPPKQPADAARQIYGKIMAWNPVTKLWRVVNDTKPTGLPWRGIYDPVKQVVIVPGGGQCAGMAGVVFYRYSKDGKDLTPRNASGAPLTDPIISGGVHVAGMAVDWPNRIFYCYDHYRAKLYSVSLDTFESKLVVDAWPDAKQTGDQGAIKICWHPEMHAVIYVGLKMIAYQPEANKLSVWQRPDGFINGEKKYVPASTIFYDPDTKDILSIGGIDWDTSKFSSHYWQLHFAIDK